MLKKARVYSIPAYSIPASKNNEENQKRERERNRYGLIHHIQKVLKQLEEKGSYSTIKGFS